MKFIAISEARAQFGKFQKILTANELLHLADSSLVGWHFLTGDFRFHPKTPFDEVCTKEMVEMGMRVEQMTQFQIVGTDEIADGATLFLIEGSAIHQGCLSGCFIPKQIGVFMHHIANESRDLHMLPVRMMN